MRLVLCALAVALTTACSPTSPSSTPRTDQTVTPIGQWASAGRGLWVSASQLAQAEVPAYAVGGQAGQAALVVTVQVRNDGEQAFDPSLLQVSVRLGAEGMAADKVYSNAEGVSGQMVGLVAPGRSAAARFMFAVAQPAALNVVSVSVDPGRGRPSVTFEGSA